MAGCCGRRVKKAATQYTAVSSTIEANGESEPLEVAPNEDGDTTATPVVVAATEEHDSDWSYKTA